MLLDTYAWVEFFLGTDKGKKVESVLSKKECYTSVLSITEITKWCRKEKFDPMKFVKIIKQNSSTIYLNDFVAIGAGNVSFELGKQIKNWGLVDALIYATALFYGLTLLTGDQHFKGLENVEML